MLTRYHRWIYENHKIESVEVLREWVIQETEFQTKAIETICDRVCEKQSYLHIKFDLILSLSNLITLFPNIVLHQKFHHTHKIS